MAFNQRTLKIRSQIAMAITVAVSWLGIVQQCPAQPAPTQQLTTPTAEQPADPAKLVREIRILGNETISSEQVAGQLTTRVGRSFDRSIVQRDVRRLANLGWFIDVKPLYESTPLGQIIIFQVVERPTIRYVTYLGNEKVKDKKLAKETGLKSGGAVDPYAVEEARRKIEEYYQSKGYNQVQVTILEGTKPTDKGISFLIHEGISQKVWDVEFVGNEFVSSGRLQAIIKSKPPILKILKGYVSRTQIESDVDLLTAYYRAYGFFQAKVSRKVDYYERENWARITFVISEGQRYQVRSVKFLGNSKFEPVALSEAAKLKGGAPFEQGKMSADSQWIQELYGSHGYVFADVKPETVFLETPGQVDLLYHIDEGEQFRVGRIFVHIGGDHPHTRIQTALNRMSLRPGDIMDIRELKASERRLVASSLFNADPATGARPKISYRIPEENVLGLSSSEPSNLTGSRVASGSSGPSGVRGQSPDILGPRVLPPPGFNPTPLANSSLKVVAPSETTRQDMPADIHVDCVDLGHYQRWLQEEGMSPSLEQQTPVAQPPLDLNTKTEEPLIRGQDPGTAPPESAWWVRPQQSLPGQPSQQIRGQSPAGVPNSAYATLPVRSGNPYGGTQVAATGPESKPPSPMGSVLPVQYQQTAQTSNQQVQYTESIPPPAAGFGPTPGFSANPVPGYQAYPNGDFGFPGQPYPQQSVDIFFDGEETQTGRLQLGVGVNSDAGLIGNIVVDERNFDWQRPPRSFEDIRNGTAFRGAGQRFRIDASPGSSVHRYLVSFQEPYLMDSPISMGLSGSYFQRRFDDWDEERLGGRVSFGYQWLERDLSTLVTYRGESIDISNTSTAQGDLADLDDVRGGNALHGFRLALINDTRDNTFLTTQGHYLEVSGEQVIGSFEYPRVEADFRKYFLLSERPDHSGRHVLSYATNVGYLGDDAPIYDRFYAGGFSTMRGFDFRGASPITFVGFNGVETGGNFQWLNSLQYLFPITADEMLHGVLFCDFGTVEKKVEIQDFRVAPGFGLRVTVPAMGPAPIALDFAFPVAKADFDDEQVFSFSLGFSR